MNGPGSPEEIHIEDSFRARIYASVPCICCFYALMIFTLISLIFNVSLREEVPSAADIISSPIGKIILGAAVIGAISILVHQLILLHLLFLRFYRILSICPIIITASGIFSLYSHQRLYFP
ncbi:MAG: hypothetical protein ACOC35_03140 [Promethearchaeia archaeon]